jgi:thiamine-phosphate pyrophosphorylase
VPTVQLRFKSDDPAAITHEVRAAVQAVQGTGALLFINDHWREAIAAGAYGVHLGQEDRTPCPRPRCRSCAPAACAWA